MMSYYETLYCTLWVYLLLQFILLTQAGNFTINSAKTAINGCQCIPGCCTVVENWLNACQNCTTTWVTLQFATSQFTVSHFFSNSSLLLLNVSSWIIYYFLNFIKLALLKIQKYSYLVKVFLGLVRSKNDYYKLVLTELLTELISNNM